MVWLFWSLSLQSCLSWDFQMSKATLWISVLNIFACIIHLLHRSFPSMEFVFGILRKCCPFLAVAVHTVLGGLGCFRDILEGTFAVITPNGSLSHFSLLPMDSSEWKWGMQVCEADWQWASVPYTFLSEPWRALPLCYSWVCCQHSIVNFSIHYYCLGYFV